MLVHHRVSPSTTLAGAHLYTRVERDNTMSLARSQTRGPFLERPGNLTGTQGWLVTVSSTFQDLEFDGSL